jgi:hypothetical protein
MKTALLILTVLMNGDFSVFNREDISFSVFNEQPEFSIFEEEVPTVFEEPCSDIESCANALRQQVIAPRQVRTQQPRTLLEVIRDNRRDRNRSRRMGR